MNHSFQLNLKTFLERSTSYFPNKEIVSREPDDRIFRYTYAEFYSRTKRLANVLKTFGIQKGDRIASLAWNHHRHLELYLAGPCYGAVLHTVNLRYGEPEIIYTINHAKDRILFFDEDQLSIVEAIANQLDFIEAYVVLGKDVPETTLSPIYSYEQLLGQVDDQFSFEMMDEYSPATICYTSATTGLPKGVTYTHRSLYLYSSALLFKDVTAISETDSIMPMVPMFHVNAWGLPYAAIATGAKLVLPGYRPKVHQLLSFIESEEVTITAGAVTLGVEMVNLLEEHEYNVSSLRALWLGGQAIPKAIIDTLYYKYGVPVVQGYGATETSPLITFLHVRKEQQQMDERGHIDLRTRQGTLIPGTEMKIIDESGKEVAWDDKEMGEIYARGPWAADEYLNDERSADSFIDGWWKSGDIATIDEHGSIQIVDRNKDMIKSGGEWISSVQLENELIAHPDVLEACVVAIPDEKWLERPLACIVLKKPMNEAEVEAELIQWLIPKFPKWWLPSQFTFLKEIPKNATGKYNKKQLREVVAKKEASEI
ncbi:MAG: long-chain fatty acid--CoA ligase [Bacillota bacterium]